MVTELVPDPSNPDISRIDFATRSQGSQDGVYRKGQ